MKQGKNSLNYDSPDLIDSADFKNQGNHDNHKNQGSDNVKGWEIKKLGEVCELKPQKKEARDKLKDTDSVTFLPMEDLGILNKEIIGQKERLMKEVAGSYTYFANNDVLLAKITPCFENGKIGIARNLVNGIGFGSSEFIVFRSKGNIQPEYLYYFLSREQIRVEGKKFMSGAVGHKRVSKDWIENYLIPFPPLPEQQRIVVILDKAFAAIAKAKANAQQNLQNAKQLFESYLQGVFENGNWETKTIQEVTKVINGYAFASKDFKSTNTIKSIKITNVGVKEFLEEADNYLPEKFKDTLKAVQVKEGNIVIALTRTIISAGLKVAVVPKSYDGALVNQRVAALVPNEKIINQRYLYNFLTTDGVAKYVLAHVNTLMQPNLSINDLKNLAVPCPSLKTQQTIVQKLEALNAETKKLESIYQQKIKDLEELKKSVLQKAFSGELKTVRGEV